MENLLTADEVIRLIGISRSTLDRLEKAGDFPCRYRISVGRVGWSETEVSNWLAARVIVSSPNKSLDKNKKPKVQE